MNIEAVIGANYGDEGKGLFTDYLCANRPNPIVIMTNGGSQRGHTVELKDGKSHVFHHFGSGTFRNALTYFPDTYLLNPMQFIKEYEELIALGYVPKSFRSSKCTLQLPCDIALNWHLEKARGDRKHGSVGCGIWETKYRMYHGDRITLDEFCNMSYCEKNKYINDQAVKYRDIRCKEENVNCNIELFDLFMNKGFIDHFIADCEEMRKLCICYDAVTNISEKIQPSEPFTYIFENGQGLKLDQYYGIADEANTTPSFTGSIGIAKFINENFSNVQSVNLNYVSRTYLTKHGVGKFKEEQHDLLDNIIDIYNNDDGRYSKILHSDKTNVFNEWQDSLRFAALDCTELNYRINYDVEMFKKYVYDKSIDVNKNIVMTHTNELKIDPYAYDLRMNNYNCLFKSESPYSEDISVQQYNI